MNLTKLNQQGGRRHLGTHFPEACHCHGTRPGDRRRRGGTDSRGKPGTQSPCEERLRPGREWHGGQRGRARALGAGFRVVAVSRNSESLDRIHSQFAATGRIETLAGDVGSDEAAAQLRETLLKRFGVPDAVVAALSSRSADVRLRILDTATRQLKDAFDTNFFTHVAAAAR